MAKEYFCCYHSYLEAMEQLNDAERGRLFTACLIYSKTGEAQKLGGNERFVFPAFRSQIDRDNANYEEKCRKQSKNARKRWDAMASGGMPGDANDANTKTKEKAKTKKKGNNPPLPPTGGNPPEPEQPEIDFSGLSPAVLAKVNLWLAYKKERRESYKYTGLQALVTRIRNSADKYGDVAVCELIDSSMANGYQGILFDRLQQTQKPVSAPPKQGYQKPNKADELDAFYQMAAQFAEGG